MRTTILIATLLTTPLHAATPVTMQPLGELWFDQEQSAPASALPLNAPVISAELNARVSGIHADVGDTVSEGELLIELDCRRPLADQAAAKAGLRQFEAQYSFAQQQVVRADDLLKKRSISDQEVEQRKSEEQRLAAQIEGQKAVIRQSMIQVENCRINAPFKAVISQRMADKGMLAAPGTPLMKLVQVDDIEISARLNAVEAGNVSSSKKAWFEAQEKRYALALRSIVPLVDEKTKTREARFNLPAEKPVPGTTGRLVWQSGRRLIPTEYLVRRDGALGVFTAENGKAVFNRLDKALEGRPAMVSLPPDSMVVVQGRESLSHGDDLHNTDILTESSETAVTDSIE